MTAVINTNISSLNAQRNMNTSQSALATSLQRLSSGLRINSAKDDAAGLAISERFTAQIKGLSQASRNANDGISLAQTAESALGQIGDSLQRIRELSVQSANATNSASDRAALQQEVSQLVSEISRIGETTSFNGLKILDGSYTSQQYQVGANAGETIGISVADSRASKLGATTLSSTSGISSATALNTALTLNGTSIDTSGATSMTDVINAINAKVSTTGITASRSTTNSIEGGAYTTTTADRTLAINGTSVSLVTGTTQAQAITAINAVSTQTGVTAKAGTTGIELTSANGGDFTVLGSHAELGLVTASTTYTAGISLSSELGSTITEGGALATSLSLTAATQVDYKVATMDISTVDGANDALRAADAALTQINSTRAQLGAIQNRFSAVVTNLSASSENFSASRSRIMDTDFAAETAALTRGQILQQAGTAMLAQANQLPNTVLSLLK